MAEALRVRTALDKAYRPLAGQFLTTVLVELTPPKRLHRLPLNLGLLLDTSESMGGESRKLDHARQACLALIEALGAEDLVTLVTFSSDAKALLPAQRADESLRRSAEAALTQLRAEGVTSLMRGLDRVFEDVRRHAGPDRTSFVILLSDGYPTTDAGYVDEDAERYIRRVDREMRERGLSVSVIGLGDASHYDQAFLRRLADAGNGQSMYCRSPEQLGQVFEQEFQRIQRTVLSDVRLTIRDLAGTPRRLWRVFPDKKKFDQPAVEDHAFSVSLGSFQDEQSQAYLIDLVTDAGEGVEAGRRRLLTCDISWSDEGGHQRHSDYPVVLEYTADARALGQRNPEVVRLATECMDAELEEQLEDAVSTSDRKKQTAVLLRKKQVTKQLGKAAATRVLEEMESALERGEDISQDALARSSQATKPTQRLG